MIENQPLSNRFRKKIKEGGKEGKRKKKEKEEGKEKEDADKPQFECGGSG